MNYTELQELYERYADRGLTILGFPCNQFGSQEPGSADEIAAFVADKGVTFPIMSKINVNGPDAIPLFHFLKGKLGGLFGSYIKWNFTKFLVNRQGVPVQRYGPQDNPMQLEPVLQELLLKGDKSAVEATALLFLKRAAFGCILSPLSSYKNRPGKARLQGRESCRNCSVFEFAASPFKVSNMFRPNFTLAKHRLSEIVKRFAW